MHPLRALVLVPFVALSCSSEGSGTPPPATSSQATGPSKEEAALAAAKSAAQMLGSQVKTKLMDAMNRGGPENAIKVCSAEAHGIAEQVEKETGVHVGRSSLKLRNIKDAPPGWVQTWLVAQGDKKAAETKPVEGVFDAPGGRVARVLKPLAIDGICLSCHGDPAQISEPVKAALAEKYPDDKATGYKVGELRGALWAELRVPR